MASIQNLCSVINNKFSNDDVKLTLFYLATKKQSEFIDMLYYILEDDTPLFFELFGGQLLKIPTKSEFSRTNRNIKVFLYIIEKAGIDDPFKLASYKFGLYLDRLATIFIDCYDSFIKNKPIENIDLNLKERDLEKIESLYNVALELERTIKETPELNKRYTYSKRRRSSISNTQEEETVDDVNYNDLLGVETDDSNYLALNEIEDYDIVNNDTGIENTENKQEENQQQQEDDKQLSLF